MKTISTTQWKLALALSCCLISVTQTYAGTYTTKCSINGNTNDVACYDCQATDQTGLCITGDTGKKGLSPTKTHSHQMNCPSGWTIGGVTVDHSGGTITCTTGATLNQATTTCTNSDLTNGGNTWVSHFRCEYPG